MKSIRYSEYFDRVYGCFLGKCIGGTAGGPAEGRKELLDYPLDENILHTALPNDDLDLQILWLELLEDKGIYITANDMAKEFYEKVPYSPGEYGYFRKNFGRGINPPDSGKFNNRYYKNGMGCPIRSEIWGCLFPGSPELTENYVRMDGSLDHDYDSIEAEYFLASLEADAFFCRDIPTLIENALGRIDQETKLHRVLSDTVKLYGEGRSWQYTRGMILRSYGHADCTNLYQNMGFILLTLLYGGGDFRETIRLGMACGYDTDCICASAASVLGIIRGAEKLLSEDGMSDTGLKIGIRTRRREGSISDLARDVCAAGMTMADVFKECTEITARTEYKPIPSVDNRPLIAFSVEYHGDPVLTIGKETAMTLNFANRSGHDENIAVKIGLPEYISAENTSWDVCVRGGETVCLPFSAKLCEDSTVLPQKNIFTAVISDSSGARTERFGLAGGMIWYRYGPFLENNRDLTHIPPHDPYGKYITLAEDENRYDVVRDYHLNHIADINRAHVDETLPFAAIAEDGRAETVPEMLCTAEDLFDIAEIQNFEGPHVDYLIAYIDSPEERDTEIALGHTAPFKLWLNGEYAGGSDQPTWWTCENRHIAAHLKKGENTLILKCAQLSDSAKYSVMFRILNGAMTQWEDLGTRIRK